MLPGVKSGYDNLSINVLFELLSFLVWKIDPIKIICPMDLLMEQGTANEKYILS